MIRHKIHVITPERVVVTGSVSLFDARKGVEIMQRRRPDLFTMLVSHVSNSAPSR